MTALVSLASEPVLAGQDEQSQKNRLERDGHCQEGKWKGIEWVNPADRTSVHGHPSAKPHDVKEENGTTAGRARNPVADLLGFRPRKQDCFSQRLIA